MIATNLPNDEIRSGLENKINVSFLAIERWVVREKNLPSMHVLAEVKHETDDALLLDWVDSWADRDERNSHFRDGVRNVWVPKSAVTKRVEANDV